MESLVLVVHILVALMMTVLILLQQGKGADAGASFGSGASGTVFGAAGSASFLTKLTAWLALIFFCTSLALGVFAKQHSEQRMSLPSVSAPAQPQAPKPLPKIAVTPAAPESPVPSPAQAPVQNAGNSSNTPSNSP